MDREVTLVRSFYKINEFWSLEGFWNETDQCLEYITDNSSVKVAAIVADRFHEYVVKSVSPKAKSIKNHIFTNEDERASLFGSEEIIIFEDLSRFPEIISLIINSSQEISITNSNTLVVIPFDLSPVTKCYLLLLYDKSTILNKDELDFQANLLLSATFRLSYMYTNFLLREKQNNSVNGIGVLEQPTSDQIDILAHQLLQPLASLVLYCEALTDPLVDFNLKQKYLKWIPAIANFWAGFIYFFAWVSKEDGSILDSRQAKEKKKIPLTKFLIDCAIDMQPFAYQKKGCSIYVEKEIVDPISEHISLFGYEILLKQAISNLLHNAIKYSNKLSAIRISASISENEFSIIVINEGIEIPTEDREAIFEKGVRTKLAQELDPGGTGLGLFITRKIMDIHKGSVKCYCDVNKKGNYEVKFVLSFPIAYME